MIAIFIYFLSRIHRQMRKGPYAARIGSCAPVYFAGVLEYLCAEILESAGNQQSYLGSSIFLGLIFFSAGEFSRSKGKDKIVPRHVMLAIKTDHELNALLKGVLLQGAGVKPHIEPVLVRKKGEGEDEEDEEDEDEE